VTKYKKTSGPKKRPEVVMEEDRAAMEHTREVAYRNYPCCTYCRDYIHRLEDENKRLAAYGLSLKDKIRDLEDMMRMDDERR
jgi:hypothetical protein